MKNKFILASVFALALFVATMPFLGHAMTVQKADNVFVTEDVNGNLFVAGNMVVVESTVNGDVFAAGNNITIKGVVNGDVFAAGNNIEIAGTVNGSLRALASNIRVDGQIERNIMAAANNFSIENGSRVGGHITYAGASLVLDAPVGGQVDAAAAGVVVNSEVGGNMNLHFGKDGQLILSNNAVLDGNLKYTAKKEADIGSGAEVRGQVNFIPWKAPAKKAKTAAFRGIFGLFGMMGIISLVVVSLLFVYIVPKVTDKIYGHMRKKFWSGLGLGFLVLAVTPMVILLLLITILGIPLALLVATFYIVGIFFAKAFVIIGLGRLVSDWLDWKMHKVFSILVGAIIFFAVSLIPVVGWIAGFVAILWVFGAFVRTKSEIIKEWR